MARMSSHYSGLFLALVAVSILCRTASASASLFNLITIASDPRQCAEAQLPGECFAIPGCQWCCADATQSPCFLPDGAGSSSGLGESEFLSGWVRHGCPAIATLTSSNSTCADLCDIGTTATCESCEARPWCVFCRTSRTCQAPGLVCPGNEVVQQCAEPEDTSVRYVKYWQAMLVVSASVFAVSLLGIAAGCLYNWLRERRRIAAAQEARRRRREERQRLQQLAQQTQAETALTMAAVGTHLRELDHGGDDEQQALLTPEAGLDEASPHMSCRPSTILDNEAVCYLCLDARPSVTFLPCYHTCCCEACSNRLRPRANEVDCPFCRCKIEAMVSLSNILHVHTATPGGG